jgi:trehalose-phosphatase
MSSPRNVFTCWKEIIRKIRRARHLALFTDFDGTLAGIRKDPEGVALSPRVRGLLQEIAQSGAVVGVVSGRKVEDVRVRVGLGGIWYVGAHGFFLLDPSNHPVRLMSPKQRRLMRRVERDLSRRLRGVRGLRLEPKQATVAVHYRGAPAASRRLARSAVFETIRRHPQMSLLSGKSVWGLLPDARTDKWTAISFILRRERRRRAGGRWATIFAGDDATDERVFEKMDGVTIAVGKKSKTAARYCVRSPLEVRTFLERLHREMRPG